MNNLLQDLRKKNLVDNWILYDNYKDYIIINNIRLYPFIYYINDINNIFYVNDFGVVFTSKYKMLYNFDSLFVKY